MEILFNSTMFSTAAIRRLKSDGLDLKVVSDKGWLLGVKLRNGQTVAAYPISRLNPLAPPKFYMTDAECDEGIDNRNPPSKIERKLKKWCSDDQLKPAIVILKRAIKLLSTDS